MAPFNEALKFVPENDVSEPSSTTVYKGTSDPEWVVGSVPNGGYILALIVSACMKFQVNTRHRDPIHVSAHYLQACATTKYEIKLRSLKSGRGFSNIVAEFVQEGKLRVMVHCIFGVLAAPPDYPGPHLTLEPPSGYSRRLPLHEHPCESKTTKPRVTWKFHEHIQWGLDPQIVSMNSSNSSLRTNSDTVGGGGTEWGGWFTFTDKAETITTPSLAFLVDIFPNMPTLLPKGERGGLGTCWFPTMTLAMEFKFPIPTSGEYAKRTVGLYSTGRFMNDPQGRHDAYVEVWTAPSEIGEGKITPRWRDSQRCLAIATQMALTLPIEVNNSIHQRRSKL